MRPVIGILTAQSVSGPGLPALCVGCDYPAAIEAAGGMPLLLPVTAQTEESTVRQWLSLCGGILLPGGGDVAPTFYGESPLPELTRTDRAHDLAEMLLCITAASMGTPVLGICRGVQTMNVAFGGTLWQDIPTQCEHTICHYQDNAIRGELFHPLTLLENSLLAGLMGGTKQESNTFHHQAVRDVAPDFRAVAHTPDGIIEAIESAEGTMLGVQWHPENLRAQHPQHAALFHWLVSAAQRKGAL